MSFEIDNVIFYPTNMQFKYFDLINFSENVGHNPKTSTSSVLLLRYFESPAHSCRHKFATL